jgi:hypothetical protein
VLAQVRAQARITNRKALITALAMTLATLAIPVG